MSKIEHENSLKCKKGRDELMHPQAYAFRASLKRPERFPAVLEYGQGRSMSRSMSQQGLRGVYSAASRAAAVIQLRRFVHPMVAGTCGPTRYRSAEWVVAWEGL